MRFGIETNCGSRPVRRGGLEVGAILHCSQYLLKGGSIRLLTVSPNPWQMDTQWAIDN